MKTSSTIIGIRRPKIITTGERVFAIDLVDGTTLIRRTKQFMADVDNSALALTNADAVADALKVKASLKDLIGGTVEGDFTYGKKGSTFLADEAYIKALTDDAGNVPQKLCLVGNVPIEKVPAVGDAIIRKANGYRVEGFLCFELSDKAAERISVGEQIALSKERTAATVEDVD